jgi:predicted amidohydrolase YtcJ
MRSIRGALLQKAQLCHLTFEMQKLTFWCHCTLILGLTAALSCQNSANKATLLLRNGHFFTADADTTALITAVAVQGDRIIYVGDDAGAQSLIGSKTQVMDLQGAFVMPGFIEGHGHFQALGQSLRNVALGDTKSWNEIVARVVQKAKDVPPGTWIEGRGWHQEKWRKTDQPVVDGYPYHDSLSLATPDHPVVLYHASGHALFANAKAMQLAGISPETSNPAGGRIVRSPGGRLTGVFEENAMDMIDRPLNAWKNQRTEAEKKADFEENIRLATAECLRRGITSFQDAGSTFWELEQYRRLAEAGQLDVRLWAMIAQPKLSELHKLSQYPKIDLGHHHFTVRAVKAYLDGALGSYGAWLLQPYDDKPNAYGQNVTPVDTIEAIARACKEHYLQFCVHAIGDRANREALQIFQRTLYDGRSAPAESLNPGVWRWRIEHAQHVAPVDQPRFWQLGVIASMQAVHCVSDAPFVVRRLGIPRARTGAYAWRALLDQGARLTNGTDAPVENVDPLPSIYAAASRKLRPTDIAFFPEQCMTRREALLSYTQWNAYAAFEEKDKGTLAPGRLADFVVLSKDLLRCPVDEILQAKVLKTIVGGKIKFQE